MSNFVLRAKFSNRNKFYTLSANKKDWTGWDSLSQIATFRTRQKARIAFKSAKLWSVMATVEVEILELTEELKQEMLFARLRGY